MNRKPYKMIETEPVHHCYCCGQDTDNVVAAIETFLYYSLCSLCEKAELKTIDGYLQIDCPFHGHPDIKGMVQYWNAISSFNQRFGKKMRGRKGRLDWEKEIEKLRKKWKKMLEKV